LKKYAPQNGNHLPEILRGEIPKKTMDETNHHPAATCSPQKAGSLRKRLFYDIYSNPHPKLGP